ncbi:MAG: PIN domain-containing protein [Nanoarchaeota archaeon]
MAIIIDASVLCAYANIEDVHYSKARIILEKIMLKRREGLIITDHLFDETVNVVMRKKGRDEAINFGRFIMDSEFLLASTSINVFRKAWDMFQQTENFSFTDCATIAFMGVNGINRIATFDKEFKKIKEIEVVD